MDIHLELGDSSAGPLSGASMDPSRTLGPNIVGGDMGPIWVYVAGGKS